MADKITLRSQSPYFDDFDPAKDFVQVLFRPGYPVQARELTTLQTFLQEQIGRFGSTNYKEGDLVKNAEITFSNDIHELVLTSSSNTVFPSSGATSSAVLTNISTLEGKIITNAAGTVKARVVGSPTANDTSKNVGNLYIQYLTTETFDSDGGYIYADTTDNPDSTQLYYNTYSTINAASLASIAEGVFFVEGVFVKVQKQTILISNTTQYPSFHIGLYFEEDIVTQNNDPSLYDNARGSTNEGAPGAHRLKFSLTLTKKELTDPVDANFYRLATYKNGIKQETPETTNDLLANIIDMLARRTFDESGDYALRPFSHDLGTGDSENNFLFTVGPSKAYVKGYEIDRTSPTYVYLDRGLENTRLNKNNQLPVLGTTSVEVTGVTSTLPGSTNGTALNASAKLLLQSGGNTIGIARAWAIKDIFAKGVAKTKLYIYDVRMFTNITTTSSLGVSVGNDVYSGKTRGYVYSASGNNITVVNSNGKFRANQSIASDVAGTSSTIASVGVTAYQLSDVTTITSTSGFSASVVANTIENETGTLIAEFGKHIKTLKDGSTNIMDNDFYVLENTGASATAINAANGNYDSTRVHDQAEITKKLKYVYLKVSNPSVRLGENYGWLAKDKEVSLFYPDVHRVYQINESTDDTFENGVFKRLNISGAGVIPQGSMVTGSTSGAKAIVALENSSNIDQNTLASGTYHLTRKGTGVANTIEVIFTKGTAFTSGELLTVEVPSGETEYTYQVTYNSVTDAVGNDVTGNFLQDSGQRKEYYDIGRLVRKENVPAPNNDIIVFFSYFESDPTSNHYYSVDSYANEDFFKVDPRYYGMTREIKPKLKDDGIDLRNTIDFRLMVQPVSDTATSPFVFDSRNFYDQDRVVPETKFTTDFYEYLGRIDLISIEKSNFIIPIQGIPSNNPQKPQVSENGMSLFWLTIPPAVRYPEDEVRVEVVDNRRFTMRDIGKIQKRVERLEETVALSMLESQALHDDVEGRTKTGFVVDDFSLEKNNPNSPSAPEHPEYNATVDVIKKQLIPSQTSGVPIEMAVSSVVNGSQFFDGYILNNFTEEAFSTQLEATTSQLINPFATWTFYGDIKLTPSEDHWRIRKDDYFTSLYGELKPFEGSAAEFQKFSTITTASPGGASTTLTEWVGRPTTTSTASGNTITTTTRQSKRSTTTTTFDEPRVIAGTSPVTTQTGTQVIENPQDYFMRSVTVTFEADNLKPKSTHFATFGDTTVLTGLVSDADGKLTGSFTIPAQTYKAGTQTFEIKDVETVGFKSSAVGKYSSIGHLDTFQTVANVADKTVKTSTTTAIRSQSTVTVPPPPPPAPRKVARQSIPWHERSCFVAGTQVTMADGTKKNIEDVQIGEQLLGQDGVINNVLEFDHPMLDGRDLIGINGMGPFMTPEHPLYTKNGWRSFSAETFARQFPEMGNLEVKDLQIGDEILKVDGTWLVVESLEVYENEPEQQVFNFILDGNNTYFANDLLAHNRGDPGGDDPIAQMFKLPKDDFGFETSVITSIDLWFSFVDTRTTMNKVMVEIRETVNGYPGGNKHILGKTRMQTIPASAAVTTITDSNATNFVFEKPIVLKDKTEYAIVIKSPSDTMSVYVAEIGQPLLNGAGIHSSQPNVGGYYGSFFTSQNASTWNAEQSKDLTYRLKRAKFDTSSFATITLKSIEQNAGYNLGDIGAYNQGLAMETFEGSKFVRVYHPNHGFHYNNAQVTISGVDNTKTYNGIPDSDLNGTHTVQFATLNTYMIETNTNATASGKINTGIWTTFATQDIMYDSLLTNFMIMKEEGDTVTLDVKSTITSPVALTVANNQIANTAIITPYADSIEAFEVDRMIDFDEPRIVRSATNSSGTDLTMYLAFASGTEYTSPILKVGSNINPIAFRNLTGYMLNDSEIEGLTQRTYDASLEDEYVSYLQAVQSELEHSTYVTEQIDLEIPADGLTVFFDAIMEPGTSVIGAYKARQLGDDTPFEELEWIDFPPAQQVNEENYGNFVSGGTRKAVEMRVQTPFDFASFKFRLRMKTLNEAYTPAVKDLRIIADI